jgi:hypothetical protein
MKFSRVSREEGFGNSQNSEIAMQMEVTFNA